MRFWSWIWAMNGRLIGYGFDGSAELSRYMILPSRWERLNPSGGSRLSHELVLDLY